MTSSRRLVVIHAFLLGAVLLLSSCGIGGEGYGVILWSDQPDLLPNGSVAPIQEVSEINDTVTLEIEDSRDRAIFESWRVRLFEDQAEAEEYAELISPYSGSFALAGRNALPVREEADRTSEIVYRLREDEEMRILTRSEEVSDEAGFVDHWYQVLTREGVAGWVFGYYLDIPTDEPEIPEEDPKLATILSNVWRPVYFAEMIESGRYDLERFRPEFGLFPKPAEQEFELRLIGSSAIFEYREISNAAPNEYVVRDTSLHITYRNERTISIQYYIDGEGYNIAMERLDADIEELIQAEIDRREAIRDELVQRGQLLRSDSYGRISLDPDGSLRWTGFDALVPRIIPPGAGPQGSIAFDLYVSERFSDKYDGAATLTLDRSGDPVEIPLLYSYTSQGIRLIPLTNQEVRRNLVVSEPLSPLVLFFSFDN